MSEEGQDRFALGHTYKGEKFPENCQKHTKSTNFASESLVFCERFGRITSESLTLIIFKKRIAHGCFFVMSDVSKSLTTNIKNYLAILSK